MDVVHPSAFWVCLAGLSVTLVYALSILAHELGHWYAARRVGVDVEGIDLNATGGFVTFADDDSLTAGRLALIVAAGPLVTLALTAGFGLARVFVSTGRTASGIVTDYALTAGLLTNAVALAVNLLPFRALDGGQLLAAARLRRSRTRG